MSSFSTENSQRQQTYSLEYQNLSRINKQIVRLYSVIYEPLSRSKFLPCLTALGEKSDQGKAFNSMSLKPHIEYLLEKGLLVQARGQSPQCNPLIAEIVTRDTISQGLWEEMVAIVNINLPIQTLYHSKKVKVFSSLEQLIREVRIGVYRQDMQYIFQQLEWYEKYNYSSERVKLTDLLTLLLDNPFDPDWFEPLPPELYKLGLINILGDSFLKLSNATPAFYLLKTSAENLDVRFSDNLQLLLVEQLILRDDLEAAKFQVDQVSSDKQELTYIFRGWIAFLEGNYTQAISFYTSAYKFLKKNTKRKKFFFDSIAGIFFILALLQEGSPTSLQEAGGYCKIMATSNSYLNYTYAWLFKLLQIQQGDMSLKDWIYENDIYSYQNSSSIETFICSLCLYWIDEQAAKRRVPQLLKNLSDRAEAVGYYWLSVESTELLFRLKMPKSRTTEINGNNSEPALVELIEPKQPWELSLQALANLNKLEIATKPDSAKRLVWLLKLRSNSFTLQPREQKITAKGSWSKGRVIAMKRLYNGIHELEYLTPQDLEVCSHLEVNHYGYYGQAEWHFGDHAMIALIGHPLVFWEDSPSTRVDLVSREPELIVKKIKGDRLTLEFSPQLNTDNEVIIVKETPTRLKIIEVSVEHQRIANILGKNNCLNVPAKASEQVLAAISGVSPIVTVHSDIGGGLESAREVTANSTPHAHLLPAGEGLKVALLCRPFGEVGSYYRPGKGGSTVIGEIEGERLQTTRDLDLEAKLADEVSSHSKILTRYESESGEWLIEDPEDCLSLLLELQESAGKVIIEWPEGEKLRISHQAGFSNFQMQINRHNDWFSASGELKLDENLVLDMENLLALLDQTPSRFIPLGDGQFIALTEQFRQRLDELRSFGNKNGQGLQFHALTSFVLEDAIAEIENIQADKHWKAQVQKLTEVKELQPKLPSTLQAELRDYQHEGFEWMSRLAHWGVGACLADQMGLGKTIQALAVILNSAPKGANLIIAPTSVCMNWVKEAQKFAPTLNPVEFGSGDRQKTLDRLQPFDLFICSYGLLQQEDVAEMLAQIEWQTIVLDEAQAIKNANTKRSQAAMKLQGKFKLITTGTPIENHLGELWNLFRFINPGLLGSWEQFNQNFAIPIERNQNKVQRRHLKKLIQPFILRRTKTQVLSELPSRTEITLSVNMSKTEMAFYEALRQKAITKLADTDNQAGTKHLQILAEIMKLRRACCNSRLIMADSSLPSAKLELFGEVLTELLENKHKALVFSQFVDHLHIIRDYLEQNQISYQYLDGSTPAKQRKTRVDKFQGGEGDIFLISLKAGGTGLNLTAADYVIHMDPWWNPAVEDQASDRAHRIGQKRPVTIYRLVTKNTIEEKIVQLHHQKRDLADSLLEGTEMSGKVSTEVLLRLMTES